MLKPFIAAAVAAIAACANAPAAQTIAASDGSAAVGRMYHYTRSNQDGSIPEQIYQYRASATRIEVGKQVSPCTNSAYVTAAFDPERGHGVEFVGGRLARDLSQEAFAWLTYDEGSLRARIPAMELDQGVAIAGAPFVVYDFDLADLNARFAGAAPAREDFRFAVSLIWIEDGSDSIFRDLGWAEARFTRAEMHLGREALRYDVDGGLNGQLWLDAREGHVLEARFAEPNHAEYDDFRLVLQSVTDDGETAWREARAAHWRDCP